MIRNNIKISGNTSFKKLYPLFEVCNSGLSKVNLYYPYVVVRFLKMTNQERFGISSLLIVNDEVMLKYIKKDIE